MLIYIISMNKQEGRKNMRKMYVDAEEVSKDWGGSKPKAYKMIKELNERMLKDNPNLIVIAGKVNRKFYEENCYGQTKKV